MPTTTVASTAPSPTFRKPQGSRYETDPFRDEYTQIRRLIQQRVGKLPETLMLSAATPEQLWTAFIGGIRASARQHFTCHCCRRFIQTFGGVLVVDPTGAVTSPLWLTTDVPGPFKKAFARLARAAVNAGIHGVFMTDDATWGEQRTGNWWHLYGTYQHPHRSRVETATQRAALLNERYGMLQRVMAKYSRPVVEQAVRILSAGVLARDAKVKANAEWLLDLYRKPEGLLRVAAATAPEGWCHVNTGVLSTLLDDIASGSDFAAIEARWSKKLDPTKYRRPTAAPKAGTIDQAEKLFQQLNLERSLYRRYAGLDDVKEKLWQPRPQRYPAATPGLFSDLRQPAAKPSVGVELPAQPITWERFAQEVLPGAHALEVQLKNEPMPFYALTAGVYADAERLFQWGNDVSWYFRDPCPLPSGWGLNAGARWAPVSAVFYPPWAWGRSIDGGNHTRSAMFALPGAADTRPSTGGASIFPEHLRSELHGVRDVIEAHSNKSSVTTAYGKGNANGVAFQDSPRAYHVVVRVNGDAVYRLDRWR